MIVIKIDGSAEGEKKIIEQFLSLGILTINAHWKENTKDNRKLTDPENKISINEIPCVLAGVSLDNQTNYPQGTQGRYQAQLVFSF